MANNQPPASNHKFLTGYVTKLVGDGATYGFIDEQIFFQQTNVTGGPAAVNDQVYAECEYSANLPIKWNATSVKIINKAPIGHQQGPPGNTIDAPENQHTKQQQQPSLLNQQPSLLNQQPSLLNQQPSLLNQQQFNQPPPPVAVTYQQHRQQRLQRQALDPKQNQQHHQEINHQQMQQQQPPPQPQHQEHQRGPRLLDQGGNSNDFFGMNNPRPFQQQPPPPPQAPTQQQLPDNNMQPFQHDSPMGPPKFTYTSQLGSAFVQNQFIPTPFLAQQPPPMLPQPPQPTQQPQQHIQANNQQNIQRQHNKAGRFGGQQGDNKQHNDHRQQVNRRSGGGGGGNDGKGGGGFNRPRSNDRDGIHNNRSSRLNDHRDRSTGRGSARRDDSGGVRASPPAHQSNRSRTSVSSDRGAHKGRRHYEAQNIPKSRIMTDLNGCNMKQRCPSSIHVPSDLKNVILNRYFRLDIKNTPKPLLFKIEQVKSENLSDESIGNSSNTKPGSELSKMDDNNTTATDKTSLATESSGPSSAGVDSGSGATESCSSSSSLLSAEVVVGDQQQQQPKVQPESASKKDEKSEQQKVEQATPPSSRSDIRLNHKYGVKVVLISLPELESIYKSVFGTSLDSFNVDCRAHPRLDESICLLCNKGSNGGHSLIGGKFDPVLDGFVEGEHNEFERHGRQPDLIGTCKRVVLEQAGLDLSSCKNWTLISTFIYNNKSDYFSPKASVEYSFIYMPHIWTMTSDSFDERILEKESLKVDASTVLSDTNESETNCSKMDTLESDVAVVGAAAADVSGEQQQQQQQLETIPKGDEALSSSSSVDNNTSTMNDTSLDVSNLDSLKVVDIKAELDKRNVKYKPNAKKAELISLLQETIAAHQALSAETTREEDNADANKPEVCPDKEVEAATAATDVTPAPEAAVTKQAPDSAQFEQGEVAGADSTPNQDDSEGADSKSEKRKVSDTEDQTEDQSSKKVCVELSNKKQQQEKVELIKEPFLVRAREGQQQLTLVSLYDANQVSRHDQFELSVSSNILRESLVQHLSEYIFTTLIEDNRQKTLSQNLDQSNGGSSSSNVSSQETTNSDTNNNNTSKQTTTTTAFKNPSKDTIKVNLKELPVDRYINLAFTYFDSTHTGYLHFDDLNKLFANTGLTISKRALTSLVGDVDKFNYRTLPDLSPKLSPTYLYKFPQQFQRLPGASSWAGDDDSQTAVSRAAVAGKMIEYQGVKYDVEKLIEQVREADTLRVSLVDRFNYAIENSDRQAEEIHVLEVNQKSLANSIKLLNEEISNLKRERDSIKKRNENLRKGVKESISSLTDLVKDDK